MNKLIIDIDGTLMNGDQAYPGAVALICALQSKHVEFIVATNSVKSHAVQVQRLSGAGIAVGAEQIYSPIDSINLHLAQQQIHRAYTVGTSEETDQIVASQDNQAPEIIVLLDCEKCNIDYDELQRIAGLIEAGCPVITASRSPYYFKSGQRQIDTGAFVALIEAATDTSIPVFGKPALHYYQNAALRFSSPDGPIWSVGDDWQTDVLGGQAAGYRTVLVKTGKYRPGDEERGRPDACVDRADDVLKRVCD